MLENEVGLLGQLSFLWLMQEWALGRSECLVQLRLLRGAVLCCVAGLVDCISHVGGASL